MKKTMFFFAVMAMLILMGSVYHAEAQDQTRVTERKTVLAGTIWTDNKCLGETCTYMKFEIYVVSDGLVSLRFFNYCTEETYPDSKQVPLELVKDLQKVIQKFYPKTILESDGQDASFSLFEHKKNTDLLDSSTSLMDNIAKAKTKFKVDVEHYATQ